MQALQTEACKPAQLGVAFGATKAELGYNHMSHEPSPPVVTLSAAVPVLMLR